LNLTIKAAQKAKTKHEKKATLFKQKEEHQENETK
jgi:hypothetical protein